MNILTFLEKSESREKYVSCIVEKIGLSIIEEFIIKLEYMTLTLSYEGY